MGGCIYSHTYTPHEVVRETYMTKVMVTTDNGHNYDRNRQ